MFASGSTTTTTNGLPTSFYGAPKRGGSQQHQAGAVHSSSGTSMAGAPPGVYSSSQAGMPPPTSTAAYGAHQLSNPFFNLPAAGPGSAPPPQQPGAALVAAGGGPAQPVGNNPFLGNVESYMGPVQSGDGCDPNTTNTHSQSKSRSHSKHRSASLQSLVDEELDGEAIIHEAALKELAEMSGNGGFPMASEAPGQGGSSESRRGVTPAAGGGEAGGSANTNTNATGAASFLPPPTLPLPIFTAPAPTAPAPTAPSSCLGNVSSSTRASDQSGGSSGGCAGGRDENREKKDTASTSSLLMQILNKNGARTPTGGPPAQNFPPPPPISASSAIPGHGYDPNQMRPLMPETPHQNLSLNLPGQPQLQIRSAGQASGAAVVGGQIIPGHQHHQPGQPPQQQPPPGGLGALLPTMPQGSHGAHHQQQPHSGYHPGLQFGTAVLQSNGAPPHQGGALPNGSNSHEHQAPPHTIYSTIESCSTSENFFLSTLKSKTGLHHPKVDHTTSNRMWGPGPQPQNSQNAAVSSVASLVENRDELVSRLFSKSAQSPDRQHTPSSRSGGGGLGNPFGTNNTSSSLMSGGAPSFPAVVNNPGGGGSCGGGLGGGLGGSMQPKLPIEESLLPDVQNLYKEFLAYASSKNDPSLNSLLAAGSGSLGSLLGHQAGQSQPSQVGGGGAPSVLASLLGLPSGQNASGASSAASSSAAGAPPPAANINPNANNLNTSTTTDIVGQTVKSTVESYLLDFLLCQKGAMKGERDIAGSLMSKFGGVGGVGGGYGPDRRGNHLGRGGNAGGFGGGAGPYGGPAPELSVNAPGPSGIQPTTWESTATVPGTDRHCYTCSRTFDYRRTHCDNCRQPLSLVDTKQNNWECPCGQPNWLWRKTCRRCLKPRAENAQTMLSSNTDKKVDERPIWNHNIPKTTPAKRPSPTVLAKPAPAVLPPPGFKAKVNEVQSKSAQPGFLPAPQQGQGSVQQGSAPVPTSSDSQNQMNVCPEASDLPSADDPEVQEELRAWMMGAAERELSAETSSHSKQSPTITENNNNISPGILSQNKLSASCRSSFEGKHEASSPNTDGGSGKEDPMVVEGVAAAAA